MSALDYEAEYNNRARVPEHPAIMAGWAAAAVAFRAEAGANAELALPYGSTPRQTYDLFRPQRQVGDALVVFIHGGYWQALDPASFSHMARGLTNRGVPVAVVGYDLCPEVSVGAIIDEMRAAMALLWRRFGARLVVAGHSAGGHLAACMLATDWQDVEPALPAGIVRSAYALSGLFDLAPLVHTSINAKLGLDADSAREMSPLLWPAPAGHALDAVVGGAESAEYHRQSRSIVDAWALEGVTTRFEAIDGANHFTVIAPLADPASAMTARIAALAGAGAGA